MKNLIKLLLSGEFFLKLPLGGFMPKKLLFILILLICPSCVNYSELIEKRQGTEYVVEHVSWANYALIRTHGFENYFIIAFKDRVHLIPGDRILMNNSYLDCVDPCNAWLNDNYIVELPLQVLFKFSEERYALRKYHRITNHGRAFSERFK